MIEVGVVTITVGLIAGAVGQRSRFCSVGGFRDFLIARDTTLLLGVVALFAAAWLTFPLVAAVESLAAPAVVEQAEGLGGLDPLVIEGAGAAASEEGGWPGLSLAAIIFVGGIGVGAVSTVTGGCPFRQHVLAGQGSRQAVLYLVGFYIAAVAFGIWSPTVLRIVLG